MKTQQTILVVIGVLLVMLCLSQTFIEKMFYDNQYIEFHIDIPPGPMGMVPGMQPQSPFSPPPLNILQGGPRPQQQHQQQYRQQQQHRQFPAGGIQQPYLGKIDGIQQVDIPDTNIPGFAPPSKNYFYDQRQMLQEGKPDQTTITFWYQLNSDCEDNVKIVVEILYWAFDLFYNTKTEMLYLRKNMDPNKSVSIHLPAIKDFDFHYYVIQINERFSTLYFDGNLILTIQQQLIATYQNISLSFDYTDDILSKANGALEDGRIYVSENWDEDQAAFEYHKFVDHGGPNHLQYLRYDCFKSYYYSLYDSQLSTLDNFTTEGEVTGLSFNKIYLLKGIYAAYMNPIDIVDKNVTIKFWLQITEIGGEEGSDFQIIQNSFGGFSLHLSYEGKLCLYGQQEEQSCAEGYKQLIYGYWHSIVITTDSSTTDMYINGNKVQFQDDMDFFKINTQSLEILMNYSMSWTGYIEDFQVLKKYYNEDLVTEYHNKYIKNVNQCAYIYTECGFKGISDAICGSSSELQIKYMRSIRIPPGKQLALYTGEQQTGVYSVFNDNVECQELEYVSA